MYIVGEKIRVTYYFEPINRDWVVQLIDYHSDFVEVCSFKTRKSARNAVREIKKTLKDIERFE